MNSAFKMERKTGKGFAQSLLVTVLGTDRADGAGQERLIGLMDLTFILRLMPHRRVLPNLFEILGGQLPARIAVDAGCIHVKVPRDVGIELLCPVRHNCYFTPTTIESGPASDST